MAEENRQRQVRKRKLTEPVVLVAECCEQHSRPQPVRAETGTALLPHGFLRLSPAGYGASSRRPGGGGAAEGGAGRPDSFRGRAEPTVAAPAPPPPLPALLPPPGGGGSGAQRSACVRSSRGLAYPLRSRLPSAAPRPPLPLFLRCSFPASRGCACKSSSPAFWRLPICSAPSAPRGTRYGGRGPGRGRAAALSSALGSGRKRRPGRAPRARGTAAPAAPRRFCCLFGARFLWPRSCPHGLKGVRPLPPCRGNGRAPAAGECGVAPGREFPASPRVRGQGQALPLPAPRCSRGEASS